MTHPSKPPEPKGRPPRVVADRYSLVRKIGHGGMSAVYVADDALTGRVVAVKVLHSHLAVDEHVRTRFANEIRATRRVDHPNVVRALDDGTHEGKPFLVMEYVEGESLDDYLRREQRMPVDLVLTLMRQAARGLASMHAAGVVHRDVKPSNLLLAESESGSEPWAVKVADFGLARIGGRSITLQGAAIGTTAYMAPEQVVSDEPDPRTDVFALGVVMYRALTGRLPFEGETPGRTIAHQLLTPPPAPSSIAPLDPGVERIVLTALRKHPDNRYPTMSAMLKDIERALGIRQGEPRGVEMQVPDDAYQPASEEGLEAMRTLEQELASR